MTQALVINEIAFATNALTIAVIAYIFPAMT
jgi:hypothetical protein